VVLHIVKRGNRNETAVMPPESLLSALIVLALALALDKLLVKEGRP
jgi:hypothetical protein